MDWELFWQISIWLIAVPFWIGMIVESILKAYQKGKK